MTEPVERCPDTTFGAHVVQSAARELERLGALIGNWKKTTDECFDAKDARIAELESELATLRERRELESAVVDAAIDWRAVQGPTPTEYGCEQTMLEKVDALLAHRQRNNDGNR